MTTTNNELPMTDSVAPVIEPALPDHSKPLPSEERIADRDDVPFPAPSESAVPASSTSDESALATPGANMASPSAPKKITEMRSSLRHPFHQLQMVGAVKGECLPGLNDFREVPCEDLSAGGVAMLLNSPPDFETCVIALGKFPHTAYFLARVAHVEHVFRIGCQFLRRLDFDPTTGELMALRPGDKGSEVSSSTNEDSAPP